MNDEQTMEDLGFDEKVAQWEAEWKAQADKRNESDLSIEHLTESKTISIAKKVRTYLQENYPFVDNGGCKMFSDNFTYVTGGGDRGFTTHETGAVLSLIMDGGGFYDFFSPNGDMAYYGMNDGYKLEQYIYSIGYRPEWITSYCLGVYEQ